MTSALSPGAALASVLDANGVIGLSKADCLSHLPRIFAQVLVPPAVAAEVTDPTSRRALAMAARAWLKVLSPSAKSLAAAGAMRRDADRAVLALALDHPESVIVTGDRALTNRARRLGVPSVEVPDLIRILAERGAIMAAQPHLDRMRERGFGIPEHVYDEILRALGEVSTPASDK